MTVKVKLNIDPMQEILLRRGLDKGGEVQQFLTNEIARHCDPYVPMDTGVLKNTKRIEPDSITYEQPYAQKQYFENKGKGLRGKEWDKRAWADHGEDVVESVAKKAGGKSG